MNDISIAAQSTENVDVFEFEVTRELRLKHAVLVESKYFPLSFFEGGEVVKINGEMKLPL